jgi:hypothetical protein
MRYFIREMPDETILLMTESGRIVSVHDRIEEAIAACDEECAVAQVSRPAPVAVDKRRVLAVVA